MNYGRRTTKTTTHRDTPLSSTPEPMLFQDLPEVTVRANAKPLSLKTVSPVQSGKGLTSYKRMYKKNIPMGKEVPKKKKKWMTGDNALIAANAVGVAAVAGEMINSAIQDRKLKKKPQRDWSNYDPFQP